MSGSNEAKFRKMQDEMSRFEEEIGLPIPIGGALPRPPTKPMDVPPPPPPPPFLPAQLRPMGGLPPPPSIPPGFNMSLASSSSPVTFSSPPTVTSRSSSASSAVVVEAKPQPPSSTPMLYSSHHVDMSSYHAPDTPSAVLLRDYYDNASAFEEYARKAAAPPPTPLLQIPTSKSKKNSDVPPLPFQYQYPPSKRKTPKNKKLIRTAGGQSWEDPTLAEWEEDDFRLFCGDLGNDVTDEVLTRAFSRYPSFLKARVVRDKRTNKTKGFGFVSFKDPQDFIRATKEMNGRYVGSRPIKLRKSTWKNRSLEVVRKKDKEKTTLINLLTGR